MSDRMRPIPIAVLLEGILREYAASGTVFGVSPGFRGEGKPLSLFGEKLENPVGPAAGPHTQLAQNIIAAYVAGARFFELKTVQVIDGEDLPVSKPCIWVPDEGYNVEWSTELTVPQALEEYVKAWFAISLLARELGLGERDGFIFNMSVGYDLEGIRSSKIDAFLEGMKDASSLPVWKECQAAARTLLPRFHNVDEEYIAGISPRVSRSVTLSTLHGCPPEEISRIAGYLLTEKGLHTFVKCNPTLLGYQAAREMLDGMGYDYLIFDDHHFRADLQFDDAVPMLRQLGALARERGLTFGVKLTNTFPVAIGAGELPGEEMYMSGRALAPLTLAVAEKLSRAFDGALRISYSGGADAFHIGEIVSCGIWPVTVATTLLKPGGYRRLSQLVKETACARPFTRVDVEALGALAAKVRTHPHYRKPVKPIPSRKLEEKVPLLDCFLAPCKHGCPFGQDVPEYLRLLAEGQPQEALRVILHKNPLPHITGAICTHHCTQKCVRGYYETPIQIRQAKLEAALRGGEAVFAELAPGAPRPDLRVAVVGGGPAGMAAAFLLARRGARVTLFEQTGALGGVVRHVIPEFRIDSALIDADAALLDRVGVTVRLNTPAPAAGDLLEQGYTHVVLAVGAPESVPLSLEGDAPIPALDFLAACKSAPHTLPDCVRKVAVIGGGNVAMDAARAAKRLPGVEEVTVVYRRTQRYMPADEEEMSLAKSEGVKFQTLLAPLSWEKEKGMLTCRRLVLGPPDSSGRPSPVETGETVTLAADLVIGAVGEQVSASFFADNGVELGPDGLPIVHSATLETVTRGVYVAGDARQGPATVARAIADAHLIADAIAGAAPPCRLPVGRFGEAMCKKGVLKLPGRPEREHDRCLECATLCECCVDVCPNRANVAVVVPTRRQPQIVHIDGMCNECGNCATFCPYDSAPYREKFTVFGSLRDFEESEAPGFILLDRRERLVRVRLEGGVIVQTSLRDEASPLPSGVQELMEILCSEYPHLLYEGELQHVSAD